MSIFDKVVRFTKDRFGLAKESPLVYEDEFDLSKARSIGYEMMEYEYRGTTAGIGYEHPAPGNIEDYLDTYGVCGWVYICARVNATSIAQIPLKVWKRTSPKRDKWIEVVDPEHPLVKLLARPNPYMTQFEFKQALGGFLELAGNAYMEIVSNGVPKELFFLMPHKVKIVPDPVDFIRGYLYSIVGETIKFKKEEVLQVKYFNPKNQFYGISPMQAAQLPVTVDLHSSLYNKNFYKNSAIPGGVLQTDQELGDATYKRLTKEWAKVHQGVTNAHRVAILEQGLKWEKTSMTNKEMEFILTRKLSMQEILAIFGVTPIMIGIEQANYSNSYEQKRQYWEHTIIPKIILIEERLNLDLVPLFKDPDLYVEFDLAAVQAMRENKEAEARVDSTYVDRGILTINEVRASKGLEPVEWGNVWHQPGGFNPAGGMQGQEMGPGSAANPPAKEEPTKFPSQFANKRMLPSANGDVIDADFIEKATEGDAILSPFQVAKLKLLKNILEKKLK